MAERLRFDMSFGRAPRDAKFARGDDEPMRILLLADFTGPDHAARRKPLAERAPRQVDVDTFEDVLRAWAPRVTVSATDEAGGTSVIEFSDIDSFHPDALYQRLALFAPLRDLRRRLSNPATAGAAVRELQQNVPTAAPAATTLEAPPPAPESKDALFERLLGKSSAPVAKTAEAVISEIMRQAIAPHVVAAADPAATQLVSALDETIATHMRRILHDPGFQALESAWRGAHGLVTGLETGEELQLYLLDVSKEELAADIAGTAGDLEQSALHRVLAKHGPAWSVLAGDYRFLSNADDLQLLAALGAIAAQAGGPFLAEADTAILGCASVGELPDERRWARDPAAAERWGALRRSAQARSLGLALPRVLLRLPYGKAMPVEQFHFDEMPAPRHEDFLWGSPAFACALLLGQAYADNGAGMTPGDRSEILDLACHTYLDAGTRVMTPCGEVWLPERAVEAILAQGLMPFVSFKDRNAVRLVRFQSLADPPCALSGPWG